MKYESLSIIIPVYNEEKTLRAILQKIDEVDLNVKKDIIIVNDASTDNTALILEEISKEKKYTILHNEINMGKSQTVKKGLLHSSGSLVVVQDADLEYNPQNWHNFIQIFEQEEVDLVYGNRFGKNNKVIYWQNWIGNRFLSLVSSFFTYIRSGIYTTDMEVCYKMAKGEVVRNIAQTIESCSNFGIEPEITAKFSRYRLDGKRLKFKQIPIDYYPRSVQEGKHMKAFSDGFKALWEILKYNIL